MHDTRLPYLFALLLAAAVAAPAQNRTASISGVIYDESEAVIPNALVSVTHNRTGRSREIRTDDAGQFRLLGLDVGEYALQVSAEGFRTADYDGIILEIDREAVLEIALSITPCDCITVFGRAVLIEAAPSALTSVVTSDAIEQLPLDGRDYIQLATLQAGVPVARARSRDVNMGYGLQISVSGSRPYQNGFQLDGVSLVSYNGSTPASINGVNLGVDAVEEFAVHPSTFSAQYGRAAGGMINAVTKSGGNDYHGSLFYFHRNDNLDARNFFDREAPPEFRRNQFGGSLGGAIVRNRTFFFANYEGLRQARGNTTVNSTLSAAARRGELVSGTVPVDPVAARVAELYPLPNGEVFGDSGLFIFSNDQVADQDFIVGRLDHNFGDRDKLFWRYSFDDGALEDETDFALGLRSNSTRNQSAVLEHTHIFSPRLLGSARFGFLRTNTVAGRTQTQVPATDDPALAFLPGGDVIGLVNVSGVTELPGGTGALDSDIHVFNSFQPSADLSGVRGAHSFKAGFRFERTRFNTDSQNRVSGDYRFGSIESFLANRPNRFRAQLPGSDTVRGLRQWIGALYFQDAWQVSSRLTLDLGVRWEWATVPGEVNGKVANLDSIFDTEMRVGEPFFDNPSFGNVAPRIGASWDLAGNGKTVVRAGYGVYYDLLLSQYILSSAVRNPPFFARGVTTAIGQGDFPSGGFQALADDPSPDLRVERIARDIAQPYVHKWNATVEQALGSQHSFRVGYVGSRGVNLSSLTEDANLVEPEVLADGRLFFPEDGERLNPVFGRIRDRTFNAFSSYHGLQTQFVRRLSDGLQLQAAYSFSKSIDDSSDFFAVSESANSIGLPFNGDPSFNRGLSGHDVRHYWTLSGSWELPVRDGSGWRRVLGGWQLASIATYASGVPFSARLGYDAARTQTSKPEFDSGQRPDLAPGATNPVTGNPERWIDVDAFRRPTPGFLGNLGRNTLIGPDSATVDAALTKRIRLGWLGEQTVLDVRAEAFNLFNRTNFDIPSSRRMEIFNESGTREDVGRITSAGESREIQFGLKLRF